ncbi:MAG: hypothetical protein SGCHY_000389 [Lobulomycetales sp.]
MACVSSCTDLYTAKLASRFFGADVGNWALIASLLSWFNWFFSTRSYSNNFECLCIFSLIVAPVDYWFYGKPTFPIYQFLYINLHKNISQFYGSHPWHWYLSQGLAVVAFTHFPLAMYGWYTGAPFRERLKENTKASRLFDSSLFNLCVWVVFAYSLIAHKEFRFLFPLVPIFCVYTGVALYSMKKTKSNSKMRLLLTALLVLNTVPAYYLSRVHQVGVVDAVEWIRDIAAAKSEGVTGALFLMPCHSTPFQAVLHNRELDARFLTCEPPINISSLEGYMDEADVFYADPAKFLDTYFRESGKEDVQVPGQEYSIKTFRWASHILIFEALEEDVRDRLLTRGYRLKG